MDHALACLSDEDIPYNPTHLRLGDDEEYSSDSDQASDPRLAKASDLLGWWVLTSSQAQVPTATRYTHPPADSLLPRRGAKTLRCPRTPTRCPRAPVFGDYPARRAGQPP